jgi:hypothetical protein
MSNQTAPMFAVDEMPMVSKIKGKRGGTLECYQGPGKVMIYRYEPRRGVENAHQARRKFLLEFGNLKLEENASSLLMIMCSRPLGDWFFSIELN